MSISSLNTSDFIRSPLLDEAISNGYLKWGSKKITVTPGEDRSVATIKILWKDVAYTIKVHFNKPIVNKVEAKELLENQLGETVLLLSRYMYEGVDSLTYLPKSNHLQRKYANPKEHKRQDGASDVDFLNVSSIKDKIDALNAQQVKVRSKITSIQDQKLQKTTARLGRIEDTIQLLKGSQTQRSVPRMEPRIESVQRNEKKQEESEEEEEGEDCLGDSRRLRRVAQDKKIEEILITRDKAEIKQPKTKKRPKASKESKDKAENQISPVKQQESPVKLGVTYDNNYLRYFRS